MIVSRFDDVPTVQSRTEPSKDEETTTRPTPSMAREVTAFVCPVKVRGLLPSSAEKTRMRKSEEHVRTTSLDGN